MFDLKLLGRVKGFFYSELVLDIPTEPIIFGTPVEGFLCSFYDGIIALFAIYDLIPLFYYWNPSLDKRIGLVIGVEMGPSSTL